MSASPARTRAGLWSKDDAEWRHPAQIASQWREASNVDRRLLRYEVRGAWWETLAARAITLLVTREYEHLVDARRCAPARRSRSCRSCRFPILPG